MWSLKGNGDCNEALTIGRRPENRYSLAKTIYIELVDIFRRLDKHLTEKLAQVDYLRLANSPNPESEVREKPAELLR